MSVAAAPDAWCPPIDPRLCTRERLRSPPPRGRAAARGATVPSSLSLLAALVAEEGLVGAWLPGLSSSIAREMLYSGVCKGTYHSGEIILR